ncbi:MAG: flagellar filament capping protein FliD [Chromatiales bacterium]|jgi:flagellar hook-associated protein 2
MASITSLGIGSGLDIKGLVEQLVAAERAPVERRLSLREVELQAELSAFGSLKSSLSALENSLDALSTAAAGRRVSSSDATLITGSVTDDAAEGVYNIEVSSLARAQSLASDTFTDPTDTVGTGTLTLTVGGDSENAVDIVIDANNNTLEGVRDAINAADTGAQASIVNDGNGYRLLISAEATGTANAVELTVADDDGSLIDGSGLSVLAYDASIQNMTQTAAPTNAALTINGLPITSSTNVLSDVISGLTITLKGETAGSSVSLAVSEDLGPVRSALNGFVSAYNELAQVVDQVTAFNPDTGERGVLLGDSLTRGIESQLRLALSGTYGAEGSGYQSLVNLGVSTGEDGRLSIDPERLSDALEADVDGVLVLLQGFGAAFDETTNGYLGSTGLIETREDSVQTRLDTIDDERIRLDQRIELIEQRYLKQFSALDLLVSQLQSTSQFLTNQLANLPKPGDFGGGSN